MYVTGPKSWESEVQVAVQKIRNNKAVGTDELAVKLFESIGDCGIDRVMEMPNKIYKSGNVPLDLGKFIFVALSKQPATAECELNMAITILVHEVFWTLIRRARIKARPDRSK